MIAVAEGHLENVQSILEEMRIKTEEAANDTLGTEERNAILNELQDFNSQIDMEVAQAQWNGNALLNNSSTFNLQIGVSTVSTDSYTFNISNNVTGGTTFNSDGLDIVAGTVNASVSFAGAGTLSNPFTNEAVGTTAVKTGFTEIDTGNYQIEISAAGTGAAASVTVKLRNLSTNELVSIGSGVSQGTALSVNVLGGTITANGTLTGVNLGVGVQIGTVVVADDDSGVIGVAYEESGNAVSSQANAQAFMTSLDTALDQISESLSYTGAITSRLTYQESSLAVAQTRTEAARSSVEDADMAYEQLEATKLMILQQTATAMLSQANMMPQNILTLFST